ERCNFSFQCSHERDPVILGQFVPQTFLPFETYPFVWNHSTARRNAPSTGMIFHPKSRSALADETNIFFFPIRTASMVARGSRPKIRPVKTSSTTPVASAITYGTLTRGEGNPVMWPS